MAIPQNVPVSSIKALTSSVKTDFQVYRWFLYLVTQPAVREHIIKKDDVKKFYQSLDQMTLFINMVRFGILGVLISFYFSRNFIMLAVAGALLIVVYMIYVKRKTIVSQISSVLLQVDFAEDELRQKTLYQIAEMYTKKYNIPSFMDVIYRIDNFCRLAILVLFVVDFIIYALLYQANIFNNLLLVFGIYFGMIWLLNTSFIYKHIK